jgi:HK97 gp10 family phage protein
MKVLGTQDALRKMAEVRRKADLKVLRKILADAAKPVFAAIKQRTPYDPTPDDDPHLRSLVKKRSRVGRQRRGSTRVASVEIGFLRTNFANIARFQEFGTVHQDEQPFMVPTLDEHADEVFAYVGKRIAAEVTR